MSFLTNVEFFEALRAEQNSLVAAHRRNKFATALVAVFHVDQLELSAENINA